MDRELIINLGLNKHAAEQAGAQYAQAERKRIEQTTGAHAAAEAAKTVATAQASRKRVDASGAAALAEGQATAKLLSETEVAERAKAAIIEKTNRQRIDAAVRAETKEEQLLTQILSKEQVVFRARDALVQRHNQQRIDAEMMAMDASQKGWAGTEGAVGAAGKALGSFVLQMVGLNSVQAILGSIADHFQRAKQEALEAGKFVQGYREALLELAALKGDGSTTSTLREDLAFRAKTLQTAAASREFQNAALGAGESAIGVNISKPEFQKATELAGAFQAFEGTSPETHGRLIGMMPSLMGKKDVTGEEAFAKEQQLYKIFQPGGANFTSLTGQFLEQAPLVTSGLFDDPAKMAALLSAFSTTNAGGAGTNVQQFTRATVGGLGRMRGAQVEGLQEKQGEYLKNVGATNQMDPIQIGKLISADFTKQEQVAAAAGEKFNAMDYMKKHGFANQEDIMSVLAFHGLMKSGQFEKSFESRAEQPPTVQEAMKPIELRRRVDPVFEARKEEIGSDIAKLGTGQEQEALKTVLHGAFNKLKLDKEVTGEFEQVINPGFFDTKEWLFGQKHKVEMEAQKELVGEAQRLGIGLPNEMFLRGPTGAALPGAGPSNTGYQEQFMGREALGRLATEVRGQGGTLQPNFGRMAEAVDKQFAAAEKLERAAEAIIKANPPKPPAPIGGRPPVQTR